MCVCVFVHLCRRVEGVLSVSRAIGDAQLKKFVTADADVMERKVQGDDAFLILASDGLWDVFSNQDACDLVLASARSSAAELLVTEAISRGSTDNVTAVIITLNNAPK